jgi:hypothetical protein
MESDLNEEFDNTQITNQKIIEWTQEHEHILIEWADKAMCYRWLHTKANARFTSLNAWYTIPVIVISTLTGTANFAQERVPVGYQYFFAMIVGAFNIAAGIITTVQQFLKITQLNEAHRVSSIAWDKFYRNIKIELAKHPLERLEVKQMIKMSKEEFDRLMETSPMIPDNIINDFKTHFIENEAFTKIIKPEICDILIPTDEYRNPWYSIDNQSKAINEEIKNKLDKVNKVKKINELNNKIIKDFIDVFVKLNNRQPMEFEIFDNLKEKVDSSIIAKILEDNKSLLLKNNENSNNYDEIPSNDV